MPLSVAYKNNSLMAVVTGKETRAPRPKRPKEPKSYYTLAREKRFEKAALKKYAGRIAEIQKHFPGWLPI